MSVPVTGVLVDVAAVRTRLAGMTEIDNHTFEGCYNLTAVTYTGSIEQWYAIGYVAPSTADITCTDGKAVFIIGKGTDDTSVYGLTPYGETTCTEIVVPDGITSIGEWAFEDYTGLTSITIPSSVTSIGEDAFQGCTSLTDIYVNQAESTLLDNASVPDGCKIHWNSTGSGSGSV